MPISNYYLVRQLIGVFFLIDLVLYLPLFSVFFGPGYRSQDAWVKSKINRSIIITIWALGSLSLVFGVYPLLGSIALWIFFRKFFVTTRWTSVFRGGGAPGFMSHFSALYFLLIELSLTIDSTYWLTEQVWRMFRFDFALILLCAGSYKALSGYLNYDGMELGLVNPFWSYFHKLMKRVPPHHFLVNVQNYIAAFGEIVMGVMMMLPATQAIGALLCSLSFIYLLPMVRLGRLALVMAVLPILLMPDFGLSLLPNLAIGEMLIPAPTWLISSLGIATYGYIALLFLVKIHQYVNLFLNRELPPPLQNYLAKYANAVPIIMWRVFTADVSNFFIRIYKIDAKSKELIPIATEDSAYSYLTFKNFRLKHRFLQVTESITVVSVFTTLKYFKSNRVLFQQRLLTYADSLPPEIGNEICFQYVSIQRSPTQFVYHPVANFVVDRIRKIINEQTLDPNFDYSAAATYSKIREGRGYGTYAALKRV